MKVQGENGRLVKLAGVLAVALAMMMSMLVMAAPEASAHGGKFDHDSVVRAPGPCAADDVPNGNSAVIFGTEYIGCTPAGDYVVIGSDQALCDEAGGRFIGDTCTFDRARPCGERPDFHYSIGDGQCVRPALVQAEFAPKPEGRSRTVAPATPVCVASELAQEHGYSKSVGEGFTNDGTNYVVVTGQPMCQFNCADGWDINCDGKLGDFCASEYDLESVADVASCLADIAERTNTPT